jgi:hypothetical protein
MDNHKRAKVIMVMLVTGASLALLGCSDSPTPPDPSPVDKETAAAAATHLGAYYAQQTPAARVVAASASRSKSAARGLGVELPQAGTLKDDEWTWNFDTVAYDADGAVVDWDNGNWGDVVGMKTTWDYRCSFGSDQIDGMYWSDRGRGFYDLRCIDSASPYCTLNGSSQDTSSYRFNYEADDGSFGWGNDGESRWDETSTNVCWSNDYDYETGSNLYPLSGESSYLVYDKWTSRWHDAEVDEVEEDEFSGSARIIYNGTRYVPMIIDGQFTFTLDLDTGDVTNQDGTPTKELVKRHR